jgi:hypothetical protein
LAIFCLRLKFNCYAKNRQSKFEQSSEDPLKINQYTVINRWEVYTGVVVCAGIAATPVVLGVAAVGPVGGGIFAGAQSIAAIGGVGSAPLGVFGFGSSGIVAGSFAATVQSAVMTGAVTS